MFSGGGSRVSNHLRLRDRDLRRRHQPQLGFGFVFGFGLGTRIAGLRVRRSLKSLSARRISSFRSIIHSKSPPDIPTLSHCFSQREDECELPSDVLSSVAVPWRRTNFGRTAGGPFIITSYNYHAPIDEYGTCILFTVIGFLDQLNITRDSNDYLWYTTSPSESFLRGGKHPILTMLSAGNTMHVFVNDQLSGSTYGTLQDQRFTFTGDVNMHAGVNKIFLLSVAVGLPVPII